MQCKHCGRNVPYACPCTKEECCGCKGEVCLRCCISNFPLIVHEAITQGDGYLVCRRCARLFSDACPCCPEPARDRCFSCCEAYRHPCCRGRRVVFKNPTPSPIFVGPSVLPDKKDFCRLGRDDSFKILTKQVRANPAHLTRNKFTRYAAVEIEASEIKDARKLNAVIDKWNCAVVHDSSTGVHGFEINTVPACGNALSEQLEAICTALEQGKAQTSESCGLHVHVDCRDFGYQEVRKFIEVYSVIEPVLFAAVHPDRSHNTYCVPCGTRYFRKFVQGVKPEKIQVNAKHERNVSETKVLKKALLPIVYGSDALKQSAYGGKQPAFHNSRADHYGRVGEGRNELRYAAVNLHSYFLRGTIEFRMHHAALNFTEIYGWAKFLVALLDAVNKTSHHNIQQFTKVTPKEIDGVRALYDLWDVESATCVGLVVLSSLLHAKYVEHLVSKIRLVDIIRNQFGANYLPAQLFFNHANHTGDALDIAESGLTEV
jgi:hypothetical protein